EPNTSVQQSVLALLDVGICAVAEWMIVPLSWWAHGLLTLTALSTFPVWAHRIWSSLRRMQREIDCALEIGAWMGWLSFIWSLWRLRGRNSGSGAAPAILTASPSHRGRSCGATDLWGEGISSPGTQSSCRTDAKRVVVTLKSAGTATRLELEPSLEGVAGALQPPPPTHELIRWLLTSG
ncbi:MAG TPA: hypothetical protein VKP30_06815, partial [Polyangiaceae bacterium]|nr:hypothetical protein [Polyangiaceae bacterium]